MFFDGLEEEILLRPELRLFVDGAFAVSSSISTCGNTRHSTTHTEDGIPIRKLYVSNLPPKTTRSELFAVFAQYGFIKSCWVKMGDQHHSKKPTHSYAFVTYSNPADAQKALEAPNCEKMLRKRYLHTAPADSWHQPTEDAEGRVKWRPQHIPADSQQSCTEADPEAINEQTEVAEASTSSMVNASDVSIKASEVTDMAEDEHTPNILDILNEDCLHHILSYVPLRDLIVTERVSKRWQSLIQEVLAGVRWIKTSRWAHGSVTLTTAVLRRLLMRSGGALLRLHLDHQLNALNDRTAHAIAKFCPSLQELKVVGMHTKNWRPLTFGCPNLTHVEFISCTKLSDLNIEMLLKSDLKIVSLAVANNTNITGLFLAGSRPYRLQSLAFENCVSLQSSVLCGALDFMPNITVFKLNACLPTIWQFIPNLLEKLPNLVELSLTDITVSEVVYPYNLNAAKQDEFCIALSKLVELKVVSFGRNVKIGNSVLKQLARSCKKLECLDVSSCNNRSNQSLGVGDEGLAAVCVGCPSLRRLDMSYLSALTDAGVRAAAGLRGLTHLTACGNATITAEPLVQVLANCPRLQELDVCGCDSVSEEIVAAAVASLQENQRLLTIHAASTSVIDDSEEAQELPKHKYLTLNVTKDRSRRHLRPDFIDDLLERSSDDMYDVYDVYDQEDDSYEDLFEPDDDFDVYEDYFGPDGEIYLDDEHLNNYLHMMGLADAHDAVFM